MCLRLVWLKVELLDTPDHPVHVLSFCDRKVAVCVMLRETMTGQWEDKGGLRWSFFFSLCLCQEIKNVRVFQNCFYILLVELEKTFKCDWFRHANLVFLISKNQVRSGDCSLCRIYEFYTTAFKSIATFILFKRIRAAHLIAWIRLINYTSK